ncbi:hypothetical protein [Pseudazoarcus pumilus]|uniref:DUF2214 domain-containing protein n=1 Tax=Pseudazoarcus pumilus TaxID=2067960 RepID=A0A2I6SA81_9RHOO|nr:hypothetical protein [Pseudazoarcus pumilus]AUN96166.1 hypothetical protein C0099_15195 [Pseudazoarcus pumilus]
MNTPLDAWGSWLKGSLWAYPALEAVHITGIALLFGSLVVFELRMLGAARTLPAEALARLALPVSVGGFALAATSGLMLFAADAFDLLANPAFRIKMVLLVLAGLNAAAFHACDGLRCDGAARTVQLVSSIVLWLGIIVAGRMIAYV